MRTAIKLALLGFVLVSHLECAKIAVVSYNLGTSHTEFAGLIADTLVDAGHTVHFFTVEQDHSIKSNGSRKAHRHVFIPAVERNIWNDMVFRSNPFQPFSIATPSFFVNASKAFDQSCYDVIAAREMLEEMRVEKYDIGISEVYGYHGFGLLYILGVREYILASAIPLQTAYAMLFNIPQPVSYVASPLDGVGSLSTPNLSFPRRVYTILFNAMNYWYNTRIAAKNTAIFREYYPSMPALDELVRSSALVLVNTPVILDMPRPTSQKILHIGGIERKEAANVSEDVACLLNSTRDIAIVSFGTLAKTDFIQGKLLDSFLEAFGQFPDVEFLWKFDGAEKRRHVFDRYPNVHPFRWLPQKYILGHRNTRVFISHMGLNSFMEGATAGVPFVAIPLFTDQQYNTAIAVNRGTAVYVDKTKISKELVSEAIAEVLYNSKYLRTARIVREQFRLYPRQPARELSSFVEYISLYGAPPSFSLPDHSFIYTLSLDIFVPLALLCFCAFLAALFFSAVYLYLFPPTTILQYLPVQYFPFLQAEKQKVL